MRCTDCALALKHFYRFFYAQIVNPGGSVVMGLRASGDIDLLPGVWLSMTAGPAGVWNISDSVQVSISCWIGMLVIYHCFIIGRATEYLQQVRPVALRTRSRGRHVARHLAHLACSFEWHSDIILSRWECVSCLEHDRVSAVRSISHDWLAWIGFNSLVRCYVF